MRKFSLKLLVSNLSILQIRSLNEASQSLRPALSLATVAELSSKTKNPEFEALKSCKNEESAVDFLKKQKFSDTQIAKIVKRYPAIVRCRVAANLEPKFRYFTENGFESSRVNELIMKSPTILKRSLNAHLIPSLEYLKTLLVGGNNEATLWLVLNRAPWLLILNLRNSLQPNIDMLLKEGVSMDDIMKLFSSQPRGVLCSADRMVYGIGMVKKFGIKPNQRAFIHALRVVVSLSESTLKKKLEFVKSLGCSDEDVMLTILRQPIFLACSEDKLRATVEFLVETMKVEPKSVIANPKLVMYSLEKRTIPRCKVLLALREKKLVSEWKLHSSINIKEEYFVRKYIVKYLKQAPDLLDLYQGWKMDGVAIKK